MFLSGGMTDEQATSRLNEMNRIGGGRCPGDELLYGRALQAPSLAAWRGDAANVEAGQGALAHRARMNGLARAGSTGRSWRRRRRDRAGAVSPRARLSMRLLVIGGARFSGRALSELALERGHEVTLFHRTPSELLPEAEHVIGDRDQGVEPLAGRAFDAVVDTCGYVPRAVRASAELLADSGWYGFISSLSAHPEDLPPGATEDSRSSSRRSPTPRT